MPVVSVIFSIRPGCVPQVKSTLVPAARGPDAPAGLLSIHLAEIGEVNTLCCFFAGEAAAASLSEIDRWLDAVRSGPAGPALRHVDRILHHCEAPPEQWRALQRAAGVALLQRVFDRPPPSEPDSVALHPLTGRHGRTWLLTPVPSHDAALALCRASTLDPETPLRDSVLWLPVH